MAKNQIVEEEVVATEETGIAAFNPAEDLLKAMLEAETNMPQTDRRITLPRLSTYMPGKKYTDKGASGNTYVIDFNDGEHVEVNVAKLRLHRLDAHIPGRVMWPFDDNGKKSNDTKDPWCASSNGVTARKAPIFNYIGKEYKDWRNGEIVVIQEDNCQNCPFSQWVGLKDANGDQVFEQDAKGIVKARQGVPPCQETPVWVFFDIDRNIFLVYQAGNFTARSHTIGARKSRWGSIKGVNSFYDTANGTKLPEVFDANGALYPLEFTVKQVNNPPYGFTPVPTFVRSAAPMTAEEMIAVKKAQDEYKELKLRELVSGDLFGAVNEDEYDTGVVSSDQPF